MTTKKAPTKRVGVEHTPEELATLDWLKSKLKNSRSGAIKWATKKAAEELGYIPKK